MPPGILSFWPGRLLNILNIAPMNSCYESFSACTNISRIEMTQPVSQVLQWFKLEPVSDEKCWVCQTDFMAKLTDMLMRLIPYNSANENPDGRAALLRMSML